MSRPPAIVLMAVAAASWAFATVLTKVTLEQLAPLDLLAIELCVGAAAVWTVLRFRGGRRDAGHWWRYGRLGLLDPVITFALFDFGIDRTGAAEGAVLIASDGLFTAALAWLILRERLTARVLVALAVGFAGVLLVGSDGSDGDASVLGDVLVLGSSIAAAAYAVGARQLGVDGRAEPVVVTAWQLLLAAVVCARLPAVVALEGHSSLGAVDAAHVLAAVATGLLGSAVPFLLYNKAIRDLEASASAVILNLVPVFAAGLAVVLLGSTLTVMQLVGVVAIVGSLFVVARGTAAVEQSPRPTSHVTSLSPLRGRSRLDQ
jgi:drug/metabolite transporter (DMT)-like permease